MPRPAPLSHCSFCGRRFHERAGWPRTCERCGNVSYRNPVPVAVLLVPVEERGVLMVRRAIPPIGLALPGGFIEHGEDWRAAAARELLEETRLSVAAESIRELRVLSAPDGTLLVFGVAPGVRRDALASFAPSPEVSALEVIEHATEDIVFPLHARVVAEHFGAASPD